MVDIATRFRLGGDMRDFMVHEIKAPLVAGLRLWGAGSPLERLAGLRKVRHALKAMAKLPEPTKENTTDHNSHILIDARDELLSRLKLSERLVPLRVLINFAIIMRYDEPYKQLMDWWIGKLFERQSEWDLTGSNPDINIWKQDWE